MSNPTKDTSTKPAAGFATDGLIQLHWQRNYIGQPSETRMVAQGGPFTDAEDAYAWIRQMIVEKARHCPDGWEPMVCDSTSKYFVMAATPSEGPTQ